MKRYIFLMLFFLAFTTVLMPFEIKIVKEVGPTANAKWPSTSMPIRFFVDSRGSDNVAFAQALPAVQRAFTSWQSIPGQTVTFSFSGPRAAAPVSITDQSNNVLWVEQNWQFSSVILAITKTGFLIQNPPNFVDGDILFNGVNFQWSAATTTPAGKVDIQSVAQHEIGHMIGLQHSQLKNSKMLPSGSPGRVLSANEQSGARFLYPSAPPADFRTLTPGNNSVFLGGPNPTSAGFPFTTFRWTSPVGFTNFVVQFSTVATFAPASKVKSFPKGTINFFEETQTTRSQLKTFAGTPKKLFWRVQADGPGGKVKTPAIAFTFE